MRSLFAIFALGFALYAGAGTNLVSNIAVITNWNKEIVTFQRNADGTARINDPSGQLIGSAEAKALQVAADAHQRMTEEADAAAQTAMWRWDEFMATNNTMIIYISAGFGQDLIAMADNYCGWIAKSWYDGELDHYLIWFNRQTDFAPLMDFRFRRQGSTYWNYGTWVDWNTTVDVDGIPCHELTVPRKYYDSVLKTGSIIIFGGRDGFDADPHKCLISINGVNSLTSTPQCSFRTVVREGTNTVVKTYEMGYIKIENGIIKGALENE